MTTLHFISVTSPPSSESSTADSNSSVRSPVQTTIISMATSKEANRAKLLWAHRTVMCHQSYSLALVLTGSPNLYLMIIKLQESLPWAKPSVNIWLAMVWLHIIKKLLLNRQKGHLILPSHSMRVLIVYSRKNKWIASLDFGMISNVK